MNSSLPDLSAPCTFSIVPLSFDSTNEQIFAFLNQITSFSVPFELIVVLEPADVSGYIAWSSELANFNKKLVFLLSRVNSSSASKGGCLNKAISLSKGDYIVRADMDDIIFPHRLISLCDYINKFRVFPDLIYTDMVEARTGRLLSYPPPSALVYYSAFRNPLPAPTIIFRRLFFIEHDFAYPGINRCEDLSMAFSFIDSTAKIVKLTPPSVAYAGLNIFRDALNWKFNAIIRLRRNRMDFIGIMSLLFSRFAWAIYILLSLRFFAMKCYASK